MAATHALTPITIVFGVFQVDCSGLGRILSFCSFVVVGKCKEKLDWVSAYPLSCALMGLITGGSGEIPLQCFSPNHAPSVKALALVRREHADCFY